jgi:aspartate racemase
MANFAGIAVAVQQTRIVKHIGIIAHSAEGATLCYRTIWLEGVARLGAHLHPEITLSGVAMAPVLDDYDRDLGRVRAVFERDARKLAAAGADFFVLPDNTAHIALEREGPDFAIPGLHIGEVVAEAATRLKKSRIGLLGTRWTMTGPVYPGALRRRGLEWEIPDDLDMGVVDRVIFDELCLGVFSDESRAAYIDIIDKLAKRGCDAVALVCTEIPLLIGQEDSPLPVLDSTRLLARAAVEVALGDRPMPQWRGGPPRPSPLA